MSDKLTGFPTNLIDYISNLEKDVIILSANALKGVMNPNVHQVVAHYREDKITEKELSGLIDRNGMIHFIKSESIPAALNFLGQFRFSDGTNFCYKFLGDSGDLIVFKRQKGE